jgi:hypothetical protein
VKSVFTLVPATTTIDGWSVADPYYGNASFNPATGLFTVPQTGRYAIKATINFNTAATITAGLGAGVNPAFTMRRLAPVVTDLIAGNFPIFNTNVALVLTLKTILGVGCITLAGDVNLSANDVIALVYLSNGLAINLVLGGILPPGIVWSIHSLG